MRSSEELTNLELLSSIHERISRKEATGGYAVLSEPEKILEAVRCLEIGLHNGGFNQYFFNPGGDRAEIAIRGLRLIGALRTANVTERAASVRLVRFSADRTVRVAELKSMSKEQASQLDALTDEFCENPEDLERLLVEYVRGNARDFGP